MKFSSQGVWLLSLLPIACYTGSFFAGHPCTKDADCGSLACIQGVCGGSSAQASSTSSTSSSSSYEDTSTSTSTGVIHESTSTSMTSTGDTEQESTDSHSFTSSTTDDPTTTSTSSVSSSTSDSDSDTGEPTPEEICKEYCQVIVCCGDYVDDGYKCNENLVPQDTQTEELINIYCIPTFCIDSYNNELGHSQKCGNAVLNEFQCLGNLSMCSDYDIYAQESSKNPPSEKDWPCKQESIDYNNCK